MTTAKKPNSTNPARSAAAKQAAATRKANLEAAAAAEVDAAKEAHAKAVEAFQAYDPGVPVLDADGYEIIPDRSKDPGGTYKFVVDGERYELPNLQYLPFSIAQQLPHLDENQAMTMILGRYAPTLLEHAHPDQFMHISKRWMAHSQGMTLGE